MIEELHNKMKHADWYYEYSDDFTVWQRGSSTIRDIQERLKVLIQCPGGRETANKLWDLYVPKYSVNKPEFLLTTKKYIMDDKTSSFNEGQYKRLGLLAAYTEEVKAQMENGVPLLQAPLSTEFDGSKIDATIFSKKSATSDFYFINKFEMSVQIPGREEANKQTFFVNNQKQENEGVPDNYTLKKASNFLHGRPVYHEGSQSWEQIDFNKKLDNGNYAKNRFDKNYGFDLRKVVAGYSIKERANEKQMDRLVQSIERGNLQKVKFVDGQGRVEELYVSPSLKTSSLTLYDQEKKAISLDVQIEKQYISKELGEKLKTLFQQKQNLDQSQKQKESPSQAKKSTKSNQKQATEKTITKKAAKPKVG
jgi:hypothetical protein